ncbi:glycosyltransferase family 4 protein [Halovenus sp. HT40]|uniref:glycosyltransferase family 4 protein n=1 Tax=Halovenus sp. HT40 TaxID=3126691 RepID=UPI00300F1A0B
MCRTIVSTTVHPDPFNPYMGLFNYRSIRSLSLSGVQADVISPRPIAPPIGPYSEYSEIPSKYDYESHTVHYPRFPYLLPQKLFKYTISSIAAQKVLPAYLENNFQTPDICHAGHIHYDGTALVPYCKKHEIPLTVMGRGKILNNYADRSYISKKTIKNTLEYSEQILCVSESLADIAQDIVGESKATVLPNGADPERYPTACKDEIKTELGIPSEKTVILFCGGYTERKGIYEIAEAIDEVHHDDVQLVFIGHYGDLRNHLISSLESSPHESYRVLWEVPPLAVRRWFTVADILMIPSHAEGRPNTVYEAMASETAVVGSAVSGIPEQVTDNETGILIPSENASSLASALNELIENQELRREMGANGLERLLSKGWTWEAHGKKLNEIHKEIIN